MKFFEHIAQYERLYRALLGRKGSPWFVRKFVIPLSLSNVRDMKRELADQAQALRSTALLLYPIEREEDHVQQRTTAPGEKMDKENSFVGGTGSKPCRFCGVW